MSINNQTVAVEIVSAEMGDTRFDELLSRLQGSEQTTKETLPELFAYSLAQMAEYENTGYINRVLSVLNARNRAMVITIALKCSLFKFDRKAGKFDTKRKFNDDANGQEAENAAILYAETNYNFFVSDCEANIWKFEESKKKPKKEKAATTATPSERMIKSFRASFVGEISADKFKAQAEIAIAEIIKEMEYFADIEAKNPNMEKAQIIRLYQKSLAKA